MKVSSLRKAGKRRRNILLITSAIVVVLGVLGTLAYIYREDIGLTKKSETKNQNIDYGPPTPDQIEGEKTAEQQEDPNQSSKNNSSSLSEKTVNVEITSANQNGSILQIRTIIQFVTNSGNCTLKLTHNNEVVTRTAGVQSATTYSTCQGFNVPITGMSKGVWDINITYTNGQYSGSTKGSITVS